MRISQEGCEMLDLGPTEMVQSPSLETEVGRMRLEQLDLALKLVLL